MKEFGSNGLKTSNLLKTNGNQSQLYDILVNGLVLYEKHKDGELYLRRAWITRARTKLKDEVNEAVVT